MRNPIYIDLHVHTHLSPCGRPEATAEALIHRAVDKGIGALGFADHITPYPVAGCAFYAHQRPGLLADLRDEIARVGDTSNITLLVGIEADYTLAGRDCLTGALLGQVDHVICSTSHFHLTGAPKPARDTPHAKAALMLKMAREGLDVPGISVWAHPFDCSRMRPLAPILAAISDDDLAALVIQANTHRVAIEINGGPALDAAYQLATARFFNLARELGARFTITADAHHPDDLDRLDSALDWAYRMGFCDRDFVTIQEFKETQTRKKHLLEGDDL